MYEAEFEKGKYYMPKKQTRKGTGAQRRTGKKMIAAKKTRIVLAVLAAALILVLCASVYATLNSRQIITSTQLERVVNVSSLSTAQFTYNGIAQKFKDEEHKKLDYSARYNANVKVGIQMDQIRFRIDQNEKRVYATLPNIDILDISVDPNHIGYIPDRTNIDLSEAIAICQQDAENEAREADKLFEVAGENAKSTVMALIYPILESAGYELAWEE